MKSRQRPVRSVPKRWRCAWFDVGCDGHRGAYSPYCAAHAEIARRDVLRALNESGGDPRQAILWRAGDESWLFATEIEAAP